MAEKRKLLVYMYVHDKSTSKKTCRVFILQNKDIQEDLEKTCTSN